LTGRVGTEFHRDLYPDLDSDGPWLDLTGYETYDQDALDLLVTRIGPLEGASFGFRRLTGACAVSLNKLDLSFYFLKNLDRLDVEAARALGEWDQSPRAPFLIISVREPLEVDVARAFMAGQKPPTSDSCDSLLELRVPSISAEVAHVLCRRSQDLHLMVLKEPLAIDTARELAQKDRQLLWVRLEAGATKEVMAALSSNPFKQVETYFGDAPITDVMIFQEVRNAD
jgi:hypothetical protein